MVGLVQTTSSGKAMTVPQSLAKLSFSHAGKDGGKCYVAIKVGISAEPDMSVVPSSQVC